MELTIENLRSDLKLLRIEGRLDASAADQVKHTWTNEPCKYIIVDLSQVTFIDSVGLSTLVIGLKNTTQQGGDFVLLNPSEPTRVILEVTHMSTIFRIAHTLEGAIIYFK